MKDEIPEGYARVTEILSPYNDFTQIDHDVLARAADRGSRVHAYCEAYALGLFLPELDADCKPYVESFIDWFDAMVELVIHAEIRLNCPIMKISGQCDLIVQLKGDTHVSIIDIKTPATASKSWRLQTAAYQLLAKRSLDLDCTRRACLMLPKSGRSSALIEFDNHQKDQDLFLNAVELFWFFKKK